MSSSSSSITKNLLSRAHSPTTATRIHAEKIHNRPLLLKPTSADTLSDARHQRRLHRTRLAQRRKKLKPAPLSAREKRALCIYDIPATERQYSIYEPLHRLWVGYIREVLGGESTRTPPMDGPTVGARLASADFHGAEVRVVRSRCVGRVGLEGIVVRDERGVFVLVTEGNEVKVVPKEGTVFRVEVPLGPMDRSGDGDGKGGGGKEESGKRNLVFELYGDQFRYRAADRANKKFKTHFLPDL